MLRELVPHRSRDDKTMKVLASHQFGLIPELNVTAWLILGAAPEVFLYNIPLSSLQKLKNNVVLPKHCRSAFLLASSF